jgi:hypothetical protein
VDVINFTSIQVEPPFYLIEYIPRAFRPEHRIMSYCILFKGVSMRGCGDTTIFFYHYPCQSVMLQDSLVRSDSMQYPHSVKLVL